MRIGSCLASACADLINVAKSSLFALKSSMQSKELIITKTNVGTIIADIASDRKSPAYELIKNIAKLVHIAIANTQFKSRTP